MGLDVNNKDQDDCCSQEQTIEMGKYWSARANTSTKMYVNKKDDGDALAE